MVEEELAALMNLIQLWERDLKQILNFIIFNQKIPFATKRIIIKNIKPINKIELTIKPIK